MSDPSNFDPIKISDEIAALEIEAQAARGVYDDRSARIAVMLWDIKQHHPEHLKAICERAGIGRSRMFDLLKIGSGRTTVKQSREETAARQRTFAAKKRESVSLTDSSTEQPNKADNGADPDESDGEDVLTTKLPPAIRKAVTDSLAMALNPSAKQAKPKSSSAQARTEIKDRLPLLNDRDLNRAEKDIAEEKARRRGVITLHAVMRPNNNAH